MKYKILALLFFPVLFLFNSCSKQNSKEYERDRFIDSLLSEMTWDEKIGQLNLYSANASITGPSINPEYEKDIKSGKCGNIFNALTVKYIYKLQKMAVEETRLGIPLIFGYDIIHGYKTIFPIPMAEACSWDLELIENTARFSAKEASASGLNWTFNPMVDVSRDPRWGRVAEGSGEDTYLASLIAIAKVNGYQGKNLDDPFTIAACVKHFAAYGAPQGGRDYNTVDLSERELRETYLPPYKAAIDAGAATVMSAFNEVDGVPCTGSKYLMTNILRNEWGFKGFVVTDYSSISEMINHGYASDKKHAGELALNAGIDLDMQSGIYSKYLKKSMEEGKITEKIINDAVKRILKLKYDLGLFKNPYLYLDTYREKETAFSTEIMDHALMTAKKSIVLLKNEALNGQKLLPINKSIKRIALIGPLGDNQIDMLGTWHSPGDTTHVSTILNGLKNKYPNAIIEYAKGADFIGDDKSGFNSAVNLAMKSDLIICAIGEKNEQSGEAASRSNIGLPGVQQELIEALFKTGKPMVAIVMAGRPLTIEWISDNLSAILFSGHLGTRTGDAIAEVLSGDYNPSGKLVMTFPRNSGQIPIYYNYKNTGRPYNANEKFTSKYIDILNGPLYPFGYGLSYTSFEYSGLKLSKEKIKSTDSLNISFVLKNTGQTDGEEITQLYIRDLVGSVTRPVKELKGFKKVFLKAGEQKDITYSITANDLKFYTINMKFVAEPGKFKVFVGANSVDLMEADFELL